MIELLKMDKIIYDDKRKKTSLGKGKRKKEKYF